MKQLEQCFALTNLESNVDIGCTDLGQAATLPPLFTGFCMNMKRIL